MSRLLLALTGHRFTALGIGGAFLLGNICGLNIGGPWWIKTVVSFAAAVAIVLAVEGLRLLAYGWLRHHPAPESRA